MPEPIRRVYDQFATALCRRVHSRTAPRITLSRLWLMRYHLGDILSVLSGRNLSPTGMPGVLALIHGIVGGEAGDDLLRASEGAAAELRRRFPELAAIPVPPDLNAWSTDIWVAAMVSIYGEWHELAPGDAERQARTFSA